MTLQNYLIIENNVVTNICLWDGDINTWTPPLNSIQLVQSTTPALVWIKNLETKQYELVEVVGEGQLGFTWDPNTQVLTTNEPQPTTPLLDAQTDQPTASGVQSL